MIPNKNIREILELSNSEYNRIVPALFAYLFNRIKLEAFIDHVGDRREGSRIKDIARFNGYISKNCKLFGYACHAARMNNKPMPKPSAFGVLSTDARLLRRLNLIHVNHNKYRVMSLEEFDATVQAMLTCPEIKNYIGRFVSKKMKFLMDSYGETRHDIETHLKQCATMAVYKQYPRFESYLHLINVAKAQIHNKGQSFITSSTSKSRQRLQRNDDDSFEALHVNLEDAHEVEAPKPYGLEMKERLMALSKCEPRMSSRAKEFLLCAAGQYHEGFSQFLSISNDDAAQKWDYDRYMAKLQAFFEVTPERTHNLFLKLRTYINGGNLGSIGYAEREADTIR